MKMNSLILRFLFAISLTAVTTTVGHAGDPVYLGQRVAGRASIDQVSHAAWDALLRKYVDTDGYVNYHAWRRSAADGQALRSYLNSLSEANPGVQSTPDAQLAFWINAYNAVTVQGILREYPTTSIRNHTAKLIGYNIWKDLQLFVGGRPYSLEAMEHQVLRKMGDPRIHFAIVCASVGCPRLLNQAYTASDVQRQLELNSKDFFSRSQNLRFDERSRKFQLSEIMSWYGDDFGPTQSAQLRAIAKLLPTQPAQAAAQRGGANVSFLNYDWALNDQRTRNASVRR